MQSDQQQRIMGYFIEEAKEHLSTIERGLLTLQSTINDPEGIQELFRAAHSVKGGAAMLGLDSIQKISHRLEDYFKVLQEHPIQVDQTLESLFLKGFDALSDLLEELQSPLGLTEEHAQRIIATVEPVLISLGQHLDQLVAESTTGPHRPAAPPPRRPPMTTPAVVKLPASPPEDSALQLIFRSDVPTRLREMLQLFKQPEHSAPARQQLSDICRSLEQAGEQFGLRAWCDLIRAVSGAIANPSNSHRALASIVIREVKQAQELVLAGRAEAIAISPALQELLPSEVGRVPPSEDDLHTWLAAADADQSVLTSLGLDAFPVVDSQPLTEATSPPALDEPLTAAANGTGGKAGPEVGMAELNSLADLFEGEVPDLDLSWEEEVLGFQDEATVTDLDGAELPGDFSDLLANVTDTQPQRELVTEDLDFLDFLEDSGGEAARSPATGGTAPTPSPIGAVPAGADRGAADQSEVDSFEDLLSIYESEGHTGSEAALLQGLTVDDTPLDDFEGLLAELEATPHPAPATPPTTDPALRGLEAIFEDFSVAEPDLLEGLEPPIEGAEGRADMGTSEVSIAASQVASEDTGSWELDLGVDLDQAAGPAAVPAAELPAAGLTDMADFAFDETDTDLGALLEEMTVTDTGTAEPIVETSDLDMGLDELLDAIAAETTEPPTDTQTVAPLTDAQGEAWDLETTWIPPETDRSEAGDRSEVELPLASPIAHEEPANLEPTAAGQSGDEWTDQTAPTHEATAAAVTRPALSELATAVEAASPPPPSRQLVTDPWEVMFGDEEMLLTETETDTSVAGRHAPTTDTLSEPTEDTLTDSGEANLVGETGSTPPTSTEVPTEWVEEIDDFFAVEPVAPHGTEAISPAAIPSPAGSAPPPPIAQRPQEGIAPTMGPEAMAAEMPVSRQEPEEAEPELAQPWPEMAISDEFEDELDALLTSEPETHVGSLASGTADAATGEQPSDEDELGELASLGDLEYLGELEESLGELEADLADLENLDEPESRLGDLESLGELEGLAELEREAAEAEEYQPQGATPGKASPSEIAPTPPIAQPPQGGGIVLEPASPLATGGAAVTGEEFPEHLFDDLMSDEELELAEIAIEPSEGVEERGDIAATLGLEQIDLLAEAEGPAEAVDVDFPDLDQELESLALDTLDLAETADESMATAIGPELTELESFDELDALLGEDMSGVAAAADTQDFADLDMLLGSEEATDQSPTAVTAPVEELVEGEAGFAELESLLGDEAREPQPSPMATPAPTTPTSVSKAGDDEFDDLEKLLKAADETLGGPAVAANRVQTPIGRRRAMVEQTMRVPVKQLDGLSNLVGELVVSRNSLEQNQERLRQFLDNLLYQVQQLSDVGQRMRDLYERSLLEASLLSHRQGHSAPTTGTHASPNGNGDSHSTGVNFDALEMDRFTAFHTLSQEMIELIVRVRESASDIEFTGDETDQITRQFRQITTQLQESLTRSRMVPFAQAADRLPRAVRDISLKCGKQADLQVEGRDTLIDKMILEQLYDPLTHLVNNAITHGIETPEARIAAGKPPRGRITIRAFHTGNQTVIAIADDGAGIDAELVKRKAVDKGLITPQEAQTMSRLDAYDLLFLPGFSTKDKADDFAGRGVGMDVVRTSLSEIRGVINTDSTLGKGTTFTIRLPLTLSISKALLCLSNRTRIAFPMDGVEDMLDVPRDRVQTNEEGQTCILWRDTLLPFRPLADLLKYNRQMGRGSIYGGATLDDDIISVVVLRSTSNFVALQVDQVEGEREIVIKQLEGPVPKPIGIAGATVMGDGRIMPIADVLELIDLAMGRMRGGTSSMWEQQAPPPMVEEVTTTEPTVLIVDDSITVRELLSMTFTKSGYRVEQARDGQEAWEKLRSGLPCDLVFCDIEMPRMDGLELLSRLQKDPHLSQIPIAMLTSRGADRHRQMAIQLGASGYFTKPYLEEALLDAASRMLKGEVLVASGA